MTSERGREAADEKRGKKRGDKFVKITNEGVNRDVPLNPFVRDVKGGGRSHKVKPSRVSWIRGEKNPGKGRKFTSCEIDKPGLRGDKTEGAPDRGNGEGWL